MTELVRAAVPVITAAGLVAAAAVYARTRRLRPALAALLDFLTAAGLLRLAAPSSWSAIALAATVVAVRKLLSTGLRFSEEEPGRVGAAGSPRFRREPARNRARSLPPPPGP